MTKLLPAPSEEQADIIAALTSANVKVTAVAGAGKSTVAMMACDKYDQARVLLLAYNRSLKETNSATLKKLKLNNRVECYTYHALMSRVCKARCFDDVMFRNLLAKGLPPPTEAESKVFPYDLIILDEMQGHAPSTLSFLSGVYATLWLSITFAIFIHW